jgi:hypothetical protein
LVEEVSQGIYRPAGKTSRSLRKNLGGIVSVPDKIMAVSGIVIAVVSVAEVQSITFRIALL